MDSGTFAPARAGRGCYNLWPKIRYQRGSRFHALGFMRRSYSLMPGLFRARARDRPRDPSVTFGDVGVTLKTLQRHRDMHTGRWTWTVSCRFVTLKLFCWGIWGHTRAQLYWEWFSIRRPHRYYVICRRSQKSSNRNSLSKKCL